MVLVALDSLILTGFSKMPILPVLLRLTHVEILPSLKYLHFVSVSNVLVWALTFFSYSNN